MTETSHPSPREQILDAALPHVVFDGWSEDAFRAGVQDSGVDFALARSLFPKGGIDLAIAFHKRGDAQMVERLLQEDLSALRFRDRIASAVRFRLEAVEMFKEEVRRGTSLFALPHNAAEGARLIWGTADAIWSTLGDTSEDYNWYTKRATLSGVYGSVVLFWLGDDSEGHQATWEFLDRRIENVMQFEKMKAQVNANPLAAKFLSGPNWLLSKVRRPMDMPDPDLPGFIRPRGSK
ncbi:MAG: COQ9 family protein [Paracoccaceae bacterium]